MRGARLVQAGVLMITEQSGDGAFPAPDPDRLGADLSADQSRAAQILCDLVVAKAFAPVLLEGVTGSGKTEVYFEAIARALQLDAGDDAQILVLLPEISLTSQWLDRFKARFGVYPVQWHSDLGPAERRRAWHQVASNGARVVVGARSALFLPFRALSLIVVDEEHDPGFKQEEGVLYNARDMAVVRARMEACPVILSSATPALETLLNAREGRYRHCLLPSRFGSAQLPDIRALDLRVDPPESGQWLAQGWWMRWMKPWPGASRSCCFSIVAAMRRSPCADPAASVYPAPTVQHGWWNTAISGRCSAIIAAISSHRSPIARPAGRKMPWWPVARGWSGWPKKLPGAGPMPGLM
ncbi:hypothetical protein JCM17846_00120 [Iodidimonas nitroreducens]|uniref:DNA 3'-5' helicase n=1 Tax=Iodidimonas nitroreducens TaxID=1236968 RepID=A0A5A7N4N3_9PROT|nr:hypothetical protein JCM17846_00120 [Iodidimonas nitroreducens]